MPARLPQSPGGGAGRSRLPCTVPHAWLRPPVGPAPKEGRRKCHTARKKPGPQGARPGRVPAWGGRCPECGVPSPAHTQVMCRSACATGIIAPPRVRGTVLQGPQRRCSTRPAADRGFGGKALNSLLVLDDDPDMCAFITHAATSVGYAAVSATEFAGFKASLTASGTRRETQQLPWWQSTRPGW